MDAMANCNPIYRLKLSDPVWGTGTETPSNRWHQLATACALLRFKHTSVPVLIGPFWLGHRQWLQWALVGSRAEERGGRRKGSEQSPPAAWIQSNVEKFT